MRGSSGCRRTTGRNMKETSITMCGKARGLFTSGLGAGWATSKTDSQMEREFLPTATAGKSKGNGGTAYSGNETMIIYDNYNKRLLCIC